MNEPINPSANPQGKLQRMANSQRLTYWVTLMLIFVLLGGLLPPVHAASASTMEGIPNREPQPSSHNNAILAMDDATNEMILPPVLREVESIGFQPSPLISYSSMETSPASGGAEASQASAFLSPSTVPPHDGGQAAQDPAQSGLLFIENLGQFDEQARFQVWGATSGDMWLAEDAMWFTVLERLPVDKLERLDVRRTDAERTNELRRGVNLKLSFPGANPHPRLEPFNRLDTHVSYLIGNDPTKWRTDVPVWGGVRYVNLYPGVDLEIMGEDGRLVQRLVVRDMPSSLAPSPGEGWGRELRLRSEGADSLSLTGDRLRLTTAVGDLTVPLLQPVAADGAPLEMPLAQPRVNGSEVTAPFSSPPSGSLSPPAFPSTSSFPRLASPLSLGMMSFSEQGISDLLYATYLVGGVSYESYGIAVDGAGNAYMTGGADLYGEFPTTPGAFQTEKPGNLDAFVVKLNASGTGLVYATYLGGSDKDAGYAIAVDGSGNAYVTGVTLSYGFIPAAVPGFDKTHAWGREAYVVKLNSTGTGLAYASYLGSDGWSWGYGIAVDVTGNAYVTGYTDCSDFIPPGVPGFHTSPNDALGDAFVAKVEADGTGLAYATYLGGTDDDAGYAIAVDGGGNAYVTGYTWSNDFIPPGVPGFDTSFGGGLDTFVVKVEANGTGLAYAAYLGSSSDEIGYGIAVDGLGNAYVTGQTWSSDFIPPGVSGFDTSFGGIIDAFVVKVASGGMGLVYATYLGGSQYDIGHAIAVDRTGNAYVTGETASWDLIPPGVPGFDTSPDHSDGNAFMAKVVADGTGLAYATYLEGMSEDVGVAIAVDGVGDAYVAGYTQSANFIPPGVPGYDTTSGSGGFVVKLAPGGPYAISGQVTDAASTDPIPGVVISAGGTLSATTQASGYYTITGVISGTYTLTPTLTGYTFEPVTHTVVVTTQNASGKNFTGTLQAYSISGQVTDAVSSQPIPGVVISAGGTLSATTQASGYYTITGVLSGTYTLTPSLTGYTFEPVTRTVVVTTQNVSGRNFTGTLQTYSISGQVTDAVSGEPIPGVVVSAGGTLSATTEPSGYYIITGVTNGTYTLTPILEGYTFEPVTHTVVVTTQNVSGKNFTGTLQAYAISGQVTDAVSGEPIPGVVVSAGGTLSATTEPSGYYTITGLLSGTYTLKPTKTGYGFVPAARMVTVTGNIAGQNFIGGTGTYAITGTVTFIQTSLPVPTVTIRAVSKGTGSEYSATTDLTGVYTITDVPVGEYTVIASKEGYQFKPNPGEAIIINHDVRQDFTTDTPPPPPLPPVTTLRTGANFLRFPPVLPVPPTLDTDYGGLNTNIRWNLDLSDRIFQNPNVDGTNMYDGIDALADQEVWTIVRLKVGRPKYAPGFNYTNDPDCEGLQDWIENQVEEQYGNANRGSQTPIFILDNEPNHLSEWHISAAEYAHAYNCYYQYWRVEQNRPQALYVAGPAQGVQAGEVGWEVYLNDLLYPTTGERIEFADGFAMHVYGHSPGGDGSEEQRTFFQRWLNTTMSQIAGRSDTDLNERPIIFSEYNPGAGDHQVNQPWDSWADWFNITYCWVQQADRNYSPGIIGLLYFVDAEERDPGQQGTKSPWWEVSLENDADFDDSWITEEDWQNRRVHWRTLGTPGQLPPAYTPNQDDDDCVLQQASLGGLLASPLRSPAAQAPPSIGGVISGTLGLPGHYNVYQVIADLEVPAGETLTINPSTYLVFDPGRRLIVNGQLIAEGNTVFPIRFMSTDEAGWNGLHFQSSAQGSLCLGCYLENLANGSVALEVHAPVTFQYGLIRDVPDGTAISSTIPFILSNVVIDYTGTGLRLSGSPTTAHTISHLTLSRCQQGVVNQGQDLLLDNSIITDCSLAVSTELSGTTTISYTLLYNNSRDFNTASGAQLVQGPGLLSANPNFVNFPDDFHLAANSPAINAANPQADYSREPGYNGNRANLGAYGNTWEATESPPLSQMGILLSTDVSQRTGLPGQILTYTLTLTNSGSMAETYTLIADDSNTSFKSSLFADGQQAPWSIKLSPQQEVSVTVWVEVPANVTRWLTNTTLVFVGNRYGIEAEVELTTQVAAFQESGGQVIMEAEHFVGFDERTGRSWLTQTVLGDYVGSGYLSALPDTDLRFTPTYTHTSPEVRYPIHFTTTGTYYLWLRGYAPNGAGDSLYITLNDQPAKTLTGFAPQAWQWANSDVQLSGNPVTINVTEAGLHTLHLWQREDGLRLDRILLTIDDGYIPTGAGPPESEFE